MVFISPNILHIVLCVLTKIAPHKSQKVEHMKERRFSLQGAYAGFVYTYAVAPPMSLPHKTAGYLASIFWAAITAGRLLSIPLSYRFQPVKLLIFNLVRPIKHLEVIYITWWYINAKWSIYPLLCFFICLLQAGAIVTVLLLLIFYTSSIFLFVGTCLCGLFLSSIFPCMLAYTEDILDYQGKMKCYLRIKNNSAVEWVQEVK